MDRIEQLSEAERKRPAAKTEIDQLLRFPPAEPEELQNGMIEPPARLQNADDD